MFLFIKLQFQLNAAIRFFLIGFCCKSHNRRLYNGTFFRIYMDFMIAITQKLMREFNQTLNSVTLSHKYILIMLGCLLPNRYRIYARWVLKFGCRHLRVWLRKFNDLLGKYNKNLDQIFK